MSSSQAQAFPGLLKLSTAMPQRSDKRLSRLFAKFLRLLLSFSAAVWGLRSCLQWIKSESGVGSVVGPLLFVAIGVALAKIVDEETWRDWLREKASTRES
jgi:uncharacterized membrane protein YcjF (UPF0283 family)